MVDKEGQGNNIHKKAAVAASVSTTLREKKLSVTKYLVYTSSDTWNKESLKWETIEQLHGNTGCVNDLLSLRKQDTVFK